MKKTVTLDEICQDCFVDAAERIGRHHHLPPETLNDLMERSRRLVAQAGPDNIPPRVARKQSRMIAEAVGVEDPFQDMKHMANERAAEIIDDLRQRIAAAGDPFEAALRIALAGNVIDFVYKGAPDLLAAVEKMEHQPLAVDDGKRLRRELATANEVLILGDNVGETWCDRLLIERFPKHVHTTYAVRSKPVLNDVTLADAKIAGLDRVADIVSSGCDAPGTLLDLITPEMRRLFDAADVLLSKGQGNFEALFGRTERPIYYLFLVKCEHVARIIEHPVGAGVIWRFAP